MTGRAVRYRALEAAARGRRAQCAGSHAAAPQAPASLYRDQGAGPPRPMPATAGRSWGMGEERRGPACRGGGGTETGAEAEGVAPARGPLRRASPRLGRTILCGRGQLDILSRTILDNAGQ